MMKVSVKTLIRYAFLIGAAVVFAFPLYYLIAVSLSSKPHIETGSLIPDMFTKNWNDVISGFGGIGGSGITNSLIISASSVVVSLILGIPAAYAISRHKFMANKHIFFWFLTNRMTPPACLILPYLVMWRAIGIWDTLYGLVMAYMVFNVPISVWLLASFMASIPREIDEAAFIDGYSLARYFRKIFLPLCLPGIGVTSFFVWIYTWSEMFIASIISSVHSKPLTAQLMISLGRVGWGVEYGIASAAGVLTMIPGIALLYWARAYLAKGFTFGRI
jgi:glycerol transport system permease protein